MHSSTVRACPSKEDAPIASRDDRRAYCMHRLRRSPDLSLPAFYNMLADLTLIAHTALVMFVVLGQLGILIGWARAWRWTRGTIFRLTHLTCILVVMLETWFAVTCPLTTLENHWRGLAGEAVYESSFIGTWLDRLLFYSAPDWLFTTLYTLFALAVLASFLLYPPRYRHK